MGKALNIPNVATLKETEGLHLRISVADLDKGGDPVKQVLQGVTNPFLFFFEGKGAKFTLNIEPLIHESVAAIIADYQGEEK